MQFSVRLRGNSDNILDNEMRIIHISYTWYGMRELKHDYGGVWDSYPGFRPVRFAYSLHIRLIQHTSQIPRTSMHRQRPRLRLRCIPGTEEALFKNVQALLVPVLAQ